MKTLTFIVCTLLCSNVLFSQKIIDVTERTITIDAMKTEELFFGFAAGDQIVFNFSEKNRQSLKEVEILEYPYNTKFTVFEKNEVENETLLIAKTGVYRFRFYNDERRGRECKIKIQRIPVSEETEAFNTTVVWHNQYDTAYYTVQQNVVKQEYIAQQIIPLAMSQTDSSNSLFGGSKSRIIFPVQLPENTIEWYYRVSVLRDKQDEQNSFNLAEEITALIKQTQGIKFGPDYLAQLPGDTYCDVYLMDAVNATRFETGDDYQYSSIGSSIHTKSGITKIYGGFSTPLYLGINNPNAGNGVNVLLECVAIVSKEEIGVGNIEKMNVATRAVPALNMDDNITLVY
jgi:hypothetical protein